MAGAARLAWVSYNKFSEVPRGAVAGVDEKEVVFAARHLSVGAMRPAVLEMPTTGFGFGDIKMFSNHGLELANDGDLLVEMEPVRYEMELDKFVKKVKSKKEKKSISNASIFRFDEGKDDIARMQVIFYLIRLQ